MKVSELFCLYLAEKLPDVAPSTSYEPFNGGMNSFSKEILGLKETRLDGGAANLRIIKLFKDGDHPLVKIRL